MTPYSKYTDSSLPTGFPPLPSASKQCSERVRKIVGRHNGYLAEWYRSGKSNTILAWF